MSMGGFDQLGDVLSAIDTADVAFAFERGRFKGVVGHYMLVVFLALWGAVLFIRAWGGPKVDAGKEALKRVRHRLLQRDDGE
ncbi:hypothetical protein [Dyella sp. 20L07]|uniref:hypothetical protein n=1 Tax=Dyella sp. 20L07 TaxID=3384240 RepID=UPI003D2C3CE4